MIRKLNSFEIQEKWKRNRLCQPFPVVVILDNLRSAYNVGSIFRSSDGAYIEKIILCGITPKPPHPAIEKTALGATQTVPWEYEFSVLSILEKLKEKGYTLSALEITNKSLPVQEVREEHFPLALVVGNEVWGVSEAVLSACDVIFEIPLYGTKESLNVAVAYGIALFTLIERFKKFKEAKVI